MALADIMSVEMSAKYMDSSSSSSLSSESDDVSSSSSSSVISSSSSASESESDTPRASVRKKTDPRGRAGKQGGAGLSDYEDDSDLDSATSGRRRKKRKKVTKPAAPRRSPTKSNGKAKKGEKAASVAAPPTLPPPPPPPSPPPAAKDGNSSSNSSFSDSSSSDSSDLSDSETPLAPPPPPLASNDAIAATTASVTTATTRPPKRRAATKKKVTGASPSSLKVTLKLPPGFIAKNSGAAVLNSSTPASNRAKLNFQATDPAKRARTSSNTATGRKSTLTTGSRSTKKNQPAGRAQPAVGGQGAVPVVQMNGALPTATLAPSGPPILPKLIPTGPAVPAEEVRGAKELSLVDHAHVGDNPKETIESNIPTHFNDPYAQGGDILRLLDMFFFCDENGYVNSSFFLYGE